jgi:drug/metabolite transporter (DMT)-like permease
MTNPATPQPAALALPAMLTGSARLAFGPWLVRLADVSPLASAWWRMLLAAPLLALLAGLNGQWCGWPGRRLWAMTGLAGAFFAADLAVWHLGIMRTTLANATLLANAATFLLPLYGVVVLGQRLSRPAVAALLVAALGMALLLGRSAELSSQHLLGDLLCLAAAVFYTFYLVVMDKVRGATPALPSLALATLAGAMALLPPMLAAGGTLLPGNWWPILALAIGSQVIGQGLIIYAVPHLPSLVIGLALLVQPIISAAMGAWRFGEVPGPLELAGAGLVVMALLIARLPAR